MKYLHSGYILLCERADHAADGRINCHGLFDLLVVDQFPSTLKCQFIVGFGTPYERRQYRGHMEVEDPNGRTVFTADFNANDPSDLLRGHAIFPAEIAVQQEGCFTIRCSLYNWKTENVWEVTRQLWAMLREEVPSSVAAD
ncbi:MAG: hypothetical protein K2X27_03405 [Candidatus Obscuribacterales bacterium]|nr:hypothetical protein [Candidatus Obscuribacterales bacterium]